MTTSQLFACLTYHDAPAAIEFLTELGFTKRLVVTDPDDESRIVHCQMRWRDTGGVMLGSVRTDENADFQMTPGATTISLVVASDEEVDATLERAVAAGAAVVQEPHNPPHGGRTCMVRDPEGNLWNIDSYPGE